jgi:hypothetical protein
MTDCRRSSELQAGPKARYCAADIARMRAKQLAHAQTVWSHSRRRPIRAKLDFVCLLIFDRQYNHRHIGKFPVFVSTDRGHNHRAGLDRASTNVWFLLHHQRRDPRSAFAASEIEKALGFKADFQQLAYLPFVVDA